MTDRIWLEVGERVFARRYAFLDEQIGAILTDDGPVIVDTRSTAVHGREILADLRELTTLPVAAVVNTHHHWDHVFGNSAFRPAAIWGHARCAQRLRDRAEQMRQRVIGDYPELAGDLRAVAFDPPDRTFEDAAVLELGGWRIELRHLGRGHTDDDIVVIVPDAAVLFAGDLLENGATPYFGDGYPLDWPTTAEAIGRLVTGAVVPGHGPIGDLAFVERQVAEFWAIAGLAERVHGGQLALDVACRLAPYPAGDARQPIERALAQLRGELDRD